MNDLILEQLYDQFLEEAEAFIQRYKTPTQELAELRHQFATRQTYAHFWDKEP